MPASFNIEALKSQAVASRTYVLKKTENNKKDYDVEDSISNQVYIDDTQIKEKWKNNYEKNLQKVKEAVSDTKGEVILYKNTNIMFDKYVKYLKDMEQIFLEENVKMNEAEQIRKNQKAKNRIRKEKQKQKRQNKLAITNDGMYGKKLSKNMNNINGSKPMA